MPKSNTLVIKNLHAEVEGKKILNGVHLKIRSGEIHAIMGPNGSGKSTLAYAIMGHPRYVVTKGAVTFDGKNILTLPPEKRAHLGLFLGFQYPHAIPGAAFGNFLRLAKNTVIKAQKKNAKIINVAEFLPLIEREMKNAGLEKEFLGRSLNEGFSGGEKKRAEIVQLGILEPRIAILDEIDSGLDIDALKKVAQNIKTIWKRTGMGIVIITHYERILKYIAPHRVHIMHNGKITQRGGKELAKKLEKKGYHSLLSKHS